MTKPLALIALTVAVLCVAGAGENIAWGSGGLGSVRSIMSAWLHSTDHRNNLLRSRYRDQGAGLVKGRFGGYDGAQVWVMHFGYHC